MKMWYHNKIEEKLIDTDTDIIPEGFTKGRLCKDNLKNSLINKISKQDIFEFYIIQNHNFIETCEHFGIKRKHMYIILKAYNIKKSAKLSAQNNHYVRTHEQSIEIGKKSSKTQKQNWDNKSEEEKLAWAQKCSEVQKNLPDDVKEQKNEKFQSYLNKLTQEEKDAINKLRSDTCKKTWSNPDLLQRQHQTLLQNNKLRAKRKCRSNAEQKIYDTLVQLFPDLLYDYNSGVRYPYFCDFYIPQLDLFIEYQGHPSHGSRPYDKNDTKSVEESYKYHTHWLRIYTVVDVEKYRVAKENNLNYIRIYPSSTLEENLHFNNYKFKDIIEIIYNTVH